jgi:putative ATP-grasp target RiPP
MSRYATKRFADDPLVTASAQFTLGRPAPTDTNDPAVARAVTRPWGLHDLAAAVEVPDLPPVRYDHLSQVAVVEDGTGRAFVDVVSGPPTAPTTAATDGEDPPSSEDWINDFTPDDPACPF